MSTRLFDRSTSNMFQPKRELLRSTGGKMGFTLLLLLAFQLLSLCLSAQNEDFLKYRPFAGETISSILNKFQLPNNRKSIKTFYQINKLSTADQIFTHKSYNLPILLYTYNGQSIRSTIGNQNWDLAVNIQNYNLELFKKGIKDGDYRKSRELWVPAHFLRDSFEPKVVLAAGEETLEIPLFGKEHEKFPLLSHKLEGRVYYLVAGHGGPDPGAMSKFGNWDICEDEYS